MQSDIRLSSGRTITHRPLPNGSNEAIPTTGAEEMTQAEWEEYADAIVQRARQSQRRTTLVIGGRPTYHF